MCHMYSPAIIRDTTRIFTTDAQQVSTRLYTHAPFIEPCIALAAFYLFTPLKRDRWVYARKYRTLLVGCWKFVRFWQEIAPNVDNSQCPVLSRYSKSPSIRSRTEGLVIQIGNAKALHL
jgi:hypothetical protein